MNTFTLNYQQTSVLRSVLKQFLSDLSVEIAGTDRKSYRDELKDERETLREILSLLDAPAQPSEARIE